MGIKNLMFHRISFDIYSFVDLIAVKCKFHRQLDSLYRLMGYVLSPEVAKTPYFVNILHVVVGDRHTAPYKSGNRPKTTRRERKFGRHPGHAGRRSAARSLEAADLIGALSW